MIKCMLIRNNCMESMIHNEIPNTSLHENLMMEQSLTSNKHQSLTWNLVCGTSQPVVRETQEHSISLLHCLSIIHWCILIHEHTRARLRLLICRFIGQQILKFELGLKPSQLHHNQPERNCPPSSPAPVPSHRRPGAPVVIAHDQKHIKPLQALPSDWQSQCRSTCRKICLPVTIHHFPKWCPGHNHL